VKHSALGERESTRIGPLGMLRAGDISGINQAVRKQDKADLRYRLLDGRKIINLIFGE